VKGFGRFLPVFLLISGCGGAGGDGDVSPAPPLPRPEWRCRLSLGREPFPEEETRRFREEEKIHASADFAGLDPGPHRAVFRWFGPEGDLRETWGRARETGTEWRCWSWLRVSGGREGLGLLLPWSKPASGRWRVAVELDGIPGTEAFFEID